MIFVVTTGKYVLILVEISKNVTFKSFLGNFKMELLRTVLIRMFLICF